MNGRTNNRSINFHNYTGVGIRFSIVKPLLILLAILFLSGFYSAAVFAQSTTSWIDTTGGNWNDPTKWSNGVPGPNSDAVISLQGNFSINLQSDVTIKSLTFGNASRGTQTIQFFGYQITLNGGNSVISDGADTYYNGSIVNKGTLTFTGNRNKILTASLDNRGIVNIASPVDFYFPFTNEPNCKVNITKDVLIKTEYSGVIINKGSLISSSGTGRANINGRFTNEDSIVVNSGTLIFSGGGPDNFLGGTYYAAAGDSLINAVNGSNSASHAKGILTGNPDGEIIFEGNNLYADSSEVTLNFGGKGFKFVGGIIWQEGNGSWINNGKLYIEGQAQKIIAAHFINNGITELNGTFSVWYDSFINNPDKPFRIADNSDIASEYSGRFINKGSLIKEAGTGTSIISGQITNEDSLIVTSGNLTINGFADNFFFGGTYYVGTGDTLVMATGGGSMYVKGYLKGNPDGYIIFQGHNFYADSAQAVLQFGGTGLQWLDDGYFVSAGGGNWINNGLLYLKGGNTKSFSSVNFQNNGMMDINSPISVIGDHILVNNEQGTMVFHDSVSLATNRDDSFINNGLFQKTGTGEATISSSFNNSGTIDITGTLNWSNNNFNPTLASVLKFEPDQSNNYGKLNITGAANLNGKAVITLSSSSAIGDSVLILTAQQGVSGTFYSVESNIDTLGFKPSYATNSVSLKVFGINFQNQAYTAFPDTVIIAGNRSLNLYGNSMTNVDSVVLYRVSSNKLITGQITQKNTSSISLMLDLSDSVAIGTQNLLVYRSDKLAPDTAKIVLAPFISIPLFFREGTSGIAVEPAFTGGWSVLNFQSISNDESYTMVHPAVLGNVPVDMRITNVIHGQGSNLWTLSQDGADQGYFMAETQAYGNSYFYYALRIDPANVIYQQLLKPGSQESFNKIANNQIKAPFGSEVTLQYNGTMHTSKAQFNDVLFQSIVGSSNSELSNYIFSLPDWNSNLHNAVNQTLSNISSDRAYTRNELLQQVLQNLSNYKMPPTDLYNNSKQDFNKDLSHWFSEKEQEYVDKVRSEVQKSKEAEQVYENTVFGIKLKVKNTNKENQDVYNQLFNKDEQNVENTFINAPGTPVTDKERKFLYKIVGPFDPNDKTTNTLYSGVIDTDSNGVPFYSRYYIPMSKVADSLEYIISFENEAAATAPANNIVITDTLDPNVDPTSLQVVKTSYDSVFSWSRSGYIVTFKFTGINLPPNQTPPEGTGFVTYRVLPNPALTNGETIKNRASVVFDYNPQILTPTVIHEIHQVGDASLELTNIPDSVEVNTDYELDGTVNNYGPDRIDSVVLKYTIPANTTVNSVNISNGTWSMDAGVVTMNFGNMVSGQMNTIKLVLNTSQIESATNSFSLNTPTADSNPLNNTVSKDVAIASYVLAINSEKNLPIQYDLSNNYPNPFNPTTTIRFSLPQAGKTKVQIFNVLGQLVATLVNGFYQAGTYKLNVNASSWASGVYLYRIQSGSFTQVKKMILLK